MIPKIIYQFWTDENEITPNRIESLKTLKRYTKCEVKLLHSNDISEYLVKEHPLHEGFKYLSAIQKSDYLRSYFMNFHGGGYADIKRYSEYNGWDKAFDDINKDERIDIIGDREIHGGSPINEYNQEPYLSQVLCNGCFICRPNTDFTREWFRRVEQKMDEKFLLLKEHPAKDPFGTNDDYPLRWAELQGEIFHKLLIEKYDSLKIKNTLNSGISFLNYR